MRAEIDPSGCAESDLNSGVAGFDGGRSFVGETLLDRCEHLLDGQAQQPAGDAERDHVGTPIGNGLGHFLHRDFNDACAGLGHHRRQVAAAGVADHQGFRPDLDFSAETVGIEPVDADQQVKLVGQAFDRMNGQAKEALPPRRRGSGGPGCG